MTLAPPGSALWLLAHDLRLARRDLRRAGRIRLRLLWMVLVIAAILLHVIGYLLAEEIAALRYQRGSETVLDGTFVLAVTFAVFLSKAITDATDALFQRGDLDLLLSSPIPMRRVLTTRLVAIAINAGFMPMLLMLPLVNGMAIAGEFTWIGLYPLLIAMALSAAAIGAGLTFGLLAVLGPRGTRLVARALATVLGAMTFLAIQAKAVIGPDTRAAIWDALAPGHDPTGHDPSGHDPSGPQWWPVQAALGQTGPMLIVVAVALALLIGVSAALGQAYGAGVMGTLSLPRATAGGDVRGRFGASRLGALLGKERRLMLRHPGLGAQLFYQAVFLIPGTLAMMNVGGTGRHSLGGVAFLTALMTGRIAKIVVAAPFEGDESAGLAATAPVSVGRVLAAKISVASVALLLVGGIPVLIIGLRLPDALPALAIACTAAAATRMALAIARPRDLWRTGLQGRMQASTDGMLGVLIDVGWGLAGAALTRVI